MDKVALPSEGLTTRPLADYQSSHVRALIEGHRSGLVRPRSAVMTQRKSEGCPGLYFDPALVADREMYLEFVRRGLRCGLLRIGKRCRERTGLFCVTKKSDALRLVFDCRRGNQFFLPPPKVALFSGSGFQDLQVEPGASLFTASFDVQAAFYQWAVPAWISEYFCLPQV